MSIYTKIVREQLDKLARTDVDPRHVEAYMRCEYGTLDHLSRAKFNREVKVAVALIDRDGKEQAESLALSYGLAPRKEPEWVSFTKRTDDPKLAWLERRLDEAGIEHRRNGSSFHAPILEVPKSRLEDAWSILTPVDDIEDNDPRWEET